MRRGRFWRSRSGAARVRRRRSAQPASDQGQTLLHKFLHKISKACFALEYAAYAVLSYLLLCAEKPEGPGDFFEN